MSDWIAIIKVLQCEMAEIPNARSPLPGISAINPLLFAPLKLRGTLGPGTFENTTVALLTNHIRINWPTKLGNQAVNSESVCVANGYIDFFICVVVFVTALTASSKVEWRPKVKQRIENSFCILCCSLVYGISLRLKGTKRLIDLASKSLCCRRYSFSDTLVRARTTSLIVTL